MTLRPTPLRDAPAYPTLSEHGEARRRFLKLCALSSAAATLGIPLLGCPGGGGGGGGGHDWVPWDDTVPLAGAAPMPMGQPVGVVVGGGPVRVVFSDGVEKDLVVAGVFTPFDGADPAKDFGPAAEKHAQLVREQAAGQPATVLDSDVTRRALEDAIRAALNATLGEGYLEEVSLAEARQETAQVERAERSAPAEQAPAEAAAEAAPAMAAEAPAAARAPSAPAQEGAAAPARRQFKQLWRPCRREGCTSCVSK